MAKKPKTPQKERLTGVDGRDMFQTPNYATDIIIPFIKSIVIETPLTEFTIWECAAGLGKMAQRLSEHGLVVERTDISYDNSVNFLKDHPGFPFSCIVTNTPFSLKRKFFLKCLEYRVPFALLLPADYSGWLIEAVRRYGCEKVIPTRRML